MAFGTVDVFVHVDTTRVLDLVRALDMLRGLLVDDYGHAWTEEESAILKAAVAACERENLTVEASPPPPTPVPDFDWNTP